MRSHPGAPADSSELGLFIKARLAAVGLNVSELARKLKMSRSNMSAVVSGDRGVSDEVALRLGPILDVVPEDVLRLAVRYRLEKGDGAVPELAPQRSQFEVAHAHLCGEFPYRVERCTFSVAVDSKGNATVVRVFEGIAPTPNRSVRFLDFDEVLVDGLPQAPAPIVTVLERPRLEHSTSTTNNGPRLVERFTFAPEPWTRDSDPGKLTVRFAGNIPEAFKTDPPPGHVESWYSGEMRWHVWHPVARLEMAFSFGHGLPAPAQWLEPWAWMGRGPLNRVSENAAARAAAKMELKAEGSIARLIVERPLPGYTIAIAWRMGHNVERREGR